jgi:dephospho-CoA kinase
MREVANDLRKAHGPAYIIEQLYQRALEEGKDAIIESIRCIGEAQALKEYDHFFLLGVDADVDMRYARIVERGASTDHVTFAEFLQQEHAEMGNSEPFLMNIKRCLEMANIVIYNNDSPQHLFTSIEKFISK